MKLNALEAKFFDQVLNAELGIPVHAQLEYGDDTFEVILVPELNEDGQFIRCQPLIHLRSLAW